MLQRNLPATLAPAEEKIMDFEQAKQLALQAIENYLNGGSVTGDRDGYWHGQVGKDRAQHLQVYLTALTPSTLGKEEALLALFLAVFGEPSSGYFNIFSSRSSRLAGLIADKWITGKRTYAWYIENPGTVRSTVFSETALNQAVSNNKNDTWVPNEYAPYSYFDHTKATRFLLDKVLNSAQFQPRKPAILKFTKQLRIQLELDQSTFWLAMTILPQSKVRDQAFIEGATIGAFLGDQQKQTPQSSSTSSHKFNDNMTAVEISEFKTPVSTTAKLPEDAIRLFSIWLTRADAAQLVRVNKASFPQAKPMEDAEHEKEKGLQRR